MQQAREIRHGITAAMRSEKQWFSQPISFGAATMLTGLPLDVITAPGVSLLFQRSGDSDIQVTAGTTRAVVAEAFRGWSQAPDERTRASFLREAYLSMYGLMQAQITGEAPDVLGEMARLYGEALARQDAGWSNIVSGLQTGISLDGEFRQMSAKMQELWNKIPRGMRQSMASYDPRNMFSG